MKKSKSRTVPRNPFRASLSKPQYREKVGLSREEKELRRDPWEREAKHKKVNIVDYDDEDEALDETPEFQLGDDITYKGKEGMVKQPNGPEGLVGVAVDGKFELVCPKKIKRIEESLARLRELSR